MRDGSQSVLAPSRPGGRHASMPSPFTARTVRRARSIRDQRRRHMAGGRGLRTVIMSLSPRPQQLMRMCWSGFMLLASCMP
jgi:hypothetical protein